MLNVKEAAEDKLQDFPHLNAFYEDLITVHLPAQKKSDLLHQPTFKKHHDISFTIFLILLCPKLLMSVFSPTEPLSFFIQSFVSMTGRISSLPTDTMTIQQWLTADVLFYHQHRLEAAQMNGD